MKTPYIAQIEHRIAGIPCQIGVESYHRQPADGRADNDMDFYGYTDCDWVLLDRHGRRATWLDAKLTDAERDRIMDAIEQDMED
jgi:hypothetical protein